MIFWQKYKIAYKVIISIAILMLISIVVYKVYKMNLGVDDIKIMLSLLESWDQ